MASIPDEDFRGRGITGIYRNGPRKLYSAKNSSAGLEKAVVAVQKAEPGSPGVERGWRCL